MGQSLYRLLWPGLLAAVLGFAPNGALAADAAYRQIVNGVAVYLGIAPAELVRGHPPGHPESGMHGGTPVGENHVMVALFDDKTGRRITDAEVTVRITGDRGLDVRKRLEPMAIAGAASFGNYFYMPGAGPYRIRLTIRLPGAREEIRASFTWARS